MSIIATSSNNSARELIPSGNHVARCYKMIHIGTVVEAVMGENKTLNKVRVSWELPMETRVFKPENGEQPMTIDKEYTLSMHEKSNLRRDLASWRGKDFTEAEAAAFDITNLMGIPCMINITHKPSKDGQRHYENISAVTPLPKGMTAPTQINPTFILTYEGFDKERFDSLPEFIKSKMITSVEYKAMSNPEHNEVSNSTTDESDDLPF